MKDIEIYHRLCTTKSGEIAVDQHLVYVQKKGFTSRIASKLGSSSGIATATKSDAQIPVTTIREVEAYPGGRNRSRPRVVLHYWKGNKESKKTIAFPDVDKGGDKEFVAFVEFLKRKDVTVKVIGGALQKTTTQTFEAVEGRPRLAVRLRWMLPVLVVFFIGFGIGAFILKHYVFGGIFILWTLFFLYKFFIRD